MNVGRAEFHLRPDSDSDKMVGVGTLPSVIHGKVITVVCLLILIGLFTRPVAFILCGQMAVAYFMAHAPRGFWPVLNQGELAVVYCFVFLYLAMAGGGSWSVDHCVLGREKEKPASASER